MNSSNNSVNKYANSDNYDHITFISTDLWDHRISKPRNENFNKILKFKTQ